MLVQTHYDGLVIPLPMLVFLPVGSPHNLWTWVLGFLVLEKKLLRSNIKEWNFLAHNFLYLEAAEKYMKPFSCLGSGWNSKQDNCDEKVHVAGPALAQLFQPKKQLYRISICKGEEAFSICFLIYIFFFQGEIVLVSWSCSIPIGTYFSPTFLQGSRRELSPGFGTYTQVRWSPNML